MTSDHLARGAGKNGFRRWQRPLYVIINGKLTKNKAKLFMSEYNYRFIDISKKK